MTRDNIENNDCKKEVTPDEMNPSKKDKQGSTLYPFRNPSYITFHEIV